MIPLPVPREPALAGTKNPAVFIIEPDLLLRQRLVELCTSVSLQTQSFDNPASFLGAVTPDSRGCVLMDVRLPGMTGLQLQHVLSQRRIHLPLIMMTSDPDVRTAVEALKRGAFDFLETGCSNQLILDGVFRAVEWDQARSATYDRVTAIRDRLAQLTRREREVLQLLIQGKTTKQAALSLGLSAKTVENHRNRIMDKTQAHAFATLIRQVWEGANGNLASLDEDCDSVLFTARPAAALVGC